MNATELAEAPFRPFEPAHAGPVRPAPITDYERLAAAFDRARRRREALVEASQIFADALTDAFGDHLACPRGAIAFQPEDVDIAEVGLKLFIPERAIRLREDGWFGFRVTVQLSPLRHVSFPISFRRRGEAAWTVKLTRASEAFDIADSLDGADAAFRAWVDVAASCLETAVDDALPDGEQGPVEIGFDPCHE